MSSDSFMELCGTLLTEKDGALLRSCASGAGAEDSYASLPPAVSSPLIDGMRTWERALRLHLAKLRAQKLKRDGGAYAEAPSDPLDAAAVAKAALSLESPLEAEQFLDRARWDALERLQGFDYFGRDTVYAYLLKLFLLERRSLFKAEEGFAEYKGLYASIMDAAPTSIQSGEPK